MITTWLRCEKYFLTLYTQKLTIDLSLSFANFVNATTCTVADTGYFGGGMRHQFAVNPMLHSTIMRKSITFAYVQLRGNKSKAGLRSLRDKTDQTLTLHRYGTNEQCGTKQRSDVVTGIGAAQINQGLEINSSGDDIILILIVGDVCYNTITCGISQHSAVALFKLVCCSK